MFSFGPLGAVSMVCLVGGVVLIWSPGFIFRGALKCFHSAF